MYMYIHLNGRFEQVRMNDTVVNAKCHFHLVRTEKDQTPRGLLGVWLRVDVK